MQKEVGGRGRRIGNSTLDMLETSLNPRQSRSDANQKRVDLRTHTSEETLRATTHHARDTPPFQTVTKSWQPRESGSPYPHARGDPWVEHPRRTRDIPPLQTVTSGSPYPYARGDPQVKHPRRTRDSPYPHARDDLRVKHPRRARDIPPLQTVTSGSPYPHARVLIRSKIESRVIVDDVRTGKC